MNFRLSTLHNGTRLRDKFSKPLVRRTISSSELNLLIKHILILPVVFRIINNNCGCSNQLFNRKTIDRDYTDKNFLLSNCLFINC